MGQKLGLCFPLFWGGGGNHLTQCRLGRCLPSYQVAFWSMQPFGHNRHGPKIRRLCPFGGAGSPSNTMCPGPRPTSRPSGILIQPAVWPQVHNRHGPKIGGLYLFGEGELGPHLTQCDRGRGSMPSFMLIHPTVWPQYTNITERQTGHWTDRQTGREITDR